MLKITPCQRMISDRFPVASFALQVPPDRLFEIACVTDPALLRPEHRNHRTPENFYTSRSSGLLRAPAGQATYLVPPEQLRRFAGKSRLYYALAAYGQRSGEAMFSTSPEEVHAAPFIRISEDFTGKSLDRGRLRQPMADARYGAPTAVLTWGGDQAAPALAPAPAAPPPAPVAVLQYDDGYPKGIWDEAEGIAPSGLAVDSPEHEAVDEPPGYEDAPALRAAGLLPTAGQGAAYGGAAAATRGAPPTRVPLEGAEDGVELRRRRMTYGRPVARATAQEAADVAPPSSASHAVPGKDEAYEDGEEEPDASEDFAAPAGQPLGDSALPLLTIARKYEILLPPSAFESGEDRYSAVNADSEYSDPRHPAYQRFHHGLAWGFVQLTQRSGLLGRALLACQRRNAAAMTETFGPGANRLLAVVTAATPEERLMPVGDAFLWEEPWLGRFREAGRVPAFQAAQNEVAIEGLFDPNLTFARWLGFNTDRALGMFMDRVMNMGSRAARRWTVEAISPLKTEAQQHEALAALGFPSVLEFQRASPGLKASGRLGTLTHAALLAELRQLGKGPVPIPSLAQSLDAMVAAAQGRRFEARQRSLRASTAYSDTAYQVP